MLANTQLMRLMAQFSTNVNPMSILQKLKCQRKEPCRLFSVKPKAGQGAGQGVEEVTMSSLCSCPHSRRCPRHHTDVGVVPGRSYSEQVQFGHFNIDINNTCKFSLSIKGFHKRI